MTLNDLRRKKKLMEFNIPSFKSYVITAVSNSVMSAWRGGWVIYCTCY